VIAAAAGAFSGSLAWLVEPALSGLRTRLAEIPRLSEPERAAITEGAAAALAEIAHRRACRVLVLELHAARIGGRLTAADPAGRWAEYLDLSSQPQFWEALDEHYPPLLPRLRELLARRCAAMQAMARRLAADRDALTVLLGCPAGELTEVSFGAGDSHRGGQSVSVLSFTAGRVVYKPRSVQVDAVLAGVLPEILACVPAQARIRVPAVVPRGEYGWAEYVGHRYCKNPAELSAFYRGIGHWLAVMRLLGGTDLHAENVIACGPVPVVVDCETLFTPALPYPPTRFGQAFDRARELVAATVLRTGMLPLRGAALGWRGVDISAVGALPGQQPRGLVPVLADEGTDRARIGFEPGTPEAGASHPSPDPALASYWDRITAGFAEVTAILHAIDDAGRLEPLLARFARCPVRMVLRATEVYAELSRMLWHPVSLHDPAAARDRAARVLAGMARSVPSAPEDSLVIQAELADLLNGDIPFFATTPGHGQLSGPGGTTWLPRRDLVADALDQWRRADESLERHVIQGTLVSAYLSEGRLPRQRRLPAGRRRLSDLDRRRRSLAAALIGQLAAAAFRGQDGTVTWIAPVFHSTGWALQPLNLNTYGGMHGVAVLLAAYQRETAAGRADEVDEAAALLEATLHTIRITESEGDRLRASGARSRPLAPGGYSGLGSQVWSWLTLHRWGAAGSDGVARACALASQLPASIAADQTFDVLTGMAGAVVPLLHLAAVTADGQWLAQATDIGDRLIATAIRKAGTCRWSSPLWPDGIGGFAHGVTGIGWALARLALATGEPRFAETANAAFAYEETLYDVSLGGWIDLRGDGRVTAAWCHGSVGIGLATADLARRGWDVQAGLLGRAAEVTRRHELLWNHSLCHGDMGTWELTDVALESGCAPPGADRRQLDARIIGSIERNGPVSGLLRDTFTPGLLHGLGGVGYQLLRMHPACDLISVLTQE
jgi:type 2 lantibiotic biosynthesis protein LanM